MTISIEQKRAAEEKLDKAEGVAHTSVPVAGGLALIPPHGPFIALGAGFIGAGFMVYAISMRRIIRDPPDQNFRVPAELQESEQVQPVDIGQSPILSWASALREAIEGAAANTDAFVTSVERAMGARDAAEGGFVGSRLSEAAEFASGLARELARSAELCDAIPNEIVEMMDRESTLADRLPPNILAGFYQARIPHDYIFEPRSSWFPPIVKASGAQKFHLWSDSPLSNFVGRLQEWSSAGAEYAELLHDAIDAEKLWDDEEMMGTGGSLPVS